MDVLYRVGAPSNNPEPGQVFNRALDARPGKQAELRDFFNAWLPGIRQETYMLCVSEHLPEEDQHGRLSMWRAYGGQAGVALVLNGGVMFRASDALGAYSSPAAYLTPNAFAADFVRIAETIAAEAEYIRTVDRDTVKTYGFNMLRMSVGTPNTLSPSPPRAPCPPPRATIASPAAEVKRLGTGEAPWRGSEAELLRQPGPL